MLVALLLLTSNLAPQPTPALPTSARLLSLSQPAGDLRLLDQAPSVDRERELVQRIDALNLRIRAMDTDWPIPSLAATYFGFLLAPVGLGAGGMLALIGAILGPAIGSSTLLTIGLIVLGVGGFGLAVGLVGIVTGVNASADARDEKNRLVRERQLLEEELRSLRQLPQVGPRVDAPGLPNPVLLTVARF